MNSLYEMIIQTRPDIVLIKSVESYRPDYLFFPVQIKVELSNNDDEVFVLKAGKKDNILYEVELLTALYEIGLSVPRIESEVFEFNYEGNTYAGVLIQEFNRMEEVPRF